MNTPVLVPKQTLKFFSNYPTLQHHLWLAGVLKIRFIFHINFHVVANFTIFHFPCCLRIKSKIQMFKFNFNFVSLNWYDSLKLMLMCLFPKKKGFCWVQTYICTKNCFLSRLSRFSSRFILGEFFKLNGNADCYAFGTVFPFLSIFFGHCPKIRTMTL